MTRQGRAKGLLFNYLRDWALSAHGAEGWEAALARAPSERELYGGMILASSWLPVLAWNRVAATFFETHYDDPNTGMRAFCSHLGEQELTTLVKLVLKIGSPEFMLKRTGFLWGRYFDSGRFEAAELERGHWRLSLEAPADEELAAGRLTCSNGPGPWLERGLELSGVRGTVRHVRCRFEGAPRCELDARWAIG
jgi:hypothetical protein